MMEETVVKTVSIEDVTTLEDLAKKIAIHCAGAKFSPTAALRLDGFKKEDGSPTHIYLRHSEQITLKGGAVAADGSAFLLEFEDEKAVYRLDTAFFHKKMINAREYFRDRFGNDLGAIVRKIRYKITRTENAAKERAAMIAAQEKIAQHDGYGTW